MRGARAIKDEEADTLAYPPLAPADFNRKGRQRKAHRKKGKVRWLERGEGDKPLNRRDSYNRSH